jgi:small subunit ribosomal protein S9
LGIKRIRGLKRIKNKNMAKEETSTTKKVRYFEGIGRRKTAVARVKIVPGGSEFLVNGMALEKFFPMPRLKVTALAPIQNLKLEDKFSVNAKVSGGGIKAQAEAIRHGLARALVVYKPELKKLLRAFGYLTRDPRMVERKKYGLKKARRAPQWSKR